MKLANSATKTVILTVVVLSASSALAQRDAGSKVRGEYNFYGGAAGRSMRGAREYSQSYREYVRTAPQQKVEPQVAKETADAIGDYLTKAQKHMAWMRKQAEAAKDQQTLTSLDTIDKNLAAAAKHHAGLCEYCEKENVEAEGSMKCCQEIDTALAAAIAEHDKLMKRLAGAKPAAN
ncbi:MAG: hypothetical protein AB7O59_19885 [Pirellulales bacterium]